MKTETEIVDKIIEYHYLLGEPQTEMSRQLYKGRIEALEWVIGPCATRKSTEQPHLSH